MPLAPEWLYGSEALFAVLCAGFAVELVFGGLPGFRQFFALPRLVTLLVAERADRRLNRLKRSRRSRKTRGVRCNGGRHGPADELHPRPYVRVVGRRRNAFCTHSPSAGRLSGYVRRRRRRSSAPGRLNAGGDRGGSRPVAVGSQAAGRHRVARRVDRQRPRARMRPISHGPCGFT